MEHKQKRKHKRTLQVVVSCIILGIILGIGASLAISLPKNIAAMNEVKASVIELDEMKKEQEDKLNQITEEMQNIDKQIEEAKETLNETQKEKGEITLEDDTLKYAYLTFDDGPSRNTPKILDFLKANNIKATFFVIGTEGYDDIYKRIVDEGHTLALHSNTHAYDEIYVSIYAFMQDITALSNRLEKLTGFRPTIMRFPGGSNNTISNRYGGSGFMDKLTQYVKDEGYYYFDWNVDSSDATAFRKDKDAIVNSVMNGVAGKEHAIILMHDAAAKTTTVDALPQIVEGLRKKGFVLAPLKEDTPAVQFK